MPSAAKCITIYLWWDAVVLSVNDGIDLEQHLLHGESSKRQELNFPCTLNVYLHLLGNLIKGGKGTEGRESETWQMNSYMC